MIDTRQLRRRGAVYLIAEAGSNHDGDLGAALELVDMAAERGADAVKFQLFRAAELYPANCGEVDLPGGPQDFYDVLRRLELPREWLPELIRRARSRGIDLLCTPFDLDAIDLLAAHDAPALKIASPELTHLPLLEHAGRTGLPIILSTGMSTLGEIEEALGVLRSAGGTEVAVLHCVTAYPCPPEDANLGAIPALAAALGVPVGLSDHTLDPVAAPITAVALGATIIEKHITLSRERPGPDHPFAIEPDELGALVEAVREMERIDPAQRIDAASRRLGADRVTTLRGADVKQISPAERMLATCDRRALHATGAIAPGDRLGDHNVAVLRGERNLRPGLHPRYWPHLDGAVTRRPIAAGDGIEWADVVERSR